jgi:hypothetical protein
MSEQALDVTFKASTLPAIYGVDKRCVAVTLVYTQGIMYYRMRERMIVGLH